MPDVGSQADRAAFFAELAAGAGRPVPRGTVEAAVAASADRGIVDLGRRLGLALRPLPTTVARAAAFTSPDRPVLWVVDRNGEHALLAAQGGDGPAVRLAVLDGRGYRVSVEPGPDVAAVVEARAAGRAVAAFAVERVGGSSGDKVVEQGDAYAGRPLLRLWHLLSPDRTEIGIVVGFAIGLGVLTLATPIAVQSLVNFVAFGGLMQPLVVVGSLLLLFLAFAGAIHVFKFYVVEVLQRRVLVRVVSDLANRLPRVRIDARDRGFGPELVNRFFDVLTIQKAGSTLLVDGLDIALQAGIGLLVLGFYHPFLLVFDLVLIALIVFIVLGLGRGAVSTARRESHAKYEIAGGLEELARVPVAYKLVGAPEYARARLADLAKTYVDERRRHFGIVARQLIGAVSLQAIAGTSLLTLGGFLVMQGQLTLGQLVAAELIVSAALASFVKFGKQLEAWYDLLAGVEKLGILFDLPLDSDRGEPLETRPTGAAVELRRATYSYPDHTAGVRDLSLRVAPGERVAVLGGRGTGKSTLAELVTGLREAQSGVVMLDGVDIRDLADVSIRNELNLVSNLELVEGSIADNVRLGRTDVSIANVRDALERVGILGELLELPDGLQTAIACSGAPLSRGTALLLTLARAIVGQPRAIVVDAILDELDPEALRCAIKALCDPGCPWTLIVLTARDEIAELMQRTIPLAPVAVLAGEGVAR